MDQSELEKLLGRPLTPNEVANLEDYDDITENIAQSLLCMSITSTPADRTYDIREGYDTVFTDLFQSVSSVKVDGNSIDSSQYYAAFWDNRNLTYKNSIVIDDLDGKEVEITAAWLSELPLDLKKLLARAYAQSVAPTSKKNQDVKSKRVRNFQITMGDLSSDEVFMKDNAAVIAKYSICNVGYMRHGNTCSLHGVSHCGCV